MKRIVIKNKTRFVTALSLLMIAIAVIIAVSGSAAEVRTKTEETYVVCPGDTLWDIASRFAPRNTDVRSYVNRIMVKNGMDSATIFPDQLLILP